ncbi:hypothetical protein AcW1_008608 [Taiwanofungus camphoratus]|nr:hypothetical protein AcV5_008893 [Antrodia cinnamomea]KAI0951604.1 hypothetical protein AcW1_008608 [Antrodia cinnamomea]KAI0956495.1 hypothetical protein AcV7_006882 [Antrodia cinnamomea]
MGGKHYHITIDFDDGISWLCRVRRINALTPPYELQSCSLLSEAATLRFLSKTSVPVPAVSDVVLEPTNPAGVPYILLEKMRGNVLDWYNLDLPGKNKILEQLADVFIELERYPFSAIGCLDEPTSLSVGLLVVDDAAFVDADGQVKRLGPFKSVYDPVLP